jgi:hypothetical protein
MLPGLRGRGRGCGRVRWSHSAIRARAPPARRALTVGPVRKRPCVVVGAPPVLSPRAHHASFLKYDASASLSTAWHAGLWWGGGSAAPDEGGNFLPLDEGLWLRLLAWAARQPTRPPAAAEAPGADGGGRRAPGTCPGPAPGTAGGWRCRWHTGRRSRRAGSCKTGCRNQPWSRRPARARACACVGGCGCGCVRACVCARARVRVCSSMLKRNRTRIVVLYATLGRRGARDRSREACVRFPTRGPSVLAPARPPARTFHPHE